MAGPAAGVRAVAGGGSGIGAIPRTWDRVLTALLALADTIGDLDWVASIDSTIVRMHQHSAGVRHASVAGYESC